VAGPATARRLSWMAPLIAACVFSMNSCATRKAPSQHAIAIQALPVGTNIPPAWSAPSTSGDVANEWLSTFHDPQLAAIVAEATANNPDLRQAGERVEQARQSVNLLSAQLKPSISGTFSGSGTVAEPSGDAKGSYATYGLLSWELDLWGKLRAQRAAAFESYKAIGLDYAFARQSLAATVAECWYFAVETHQLLALTQDNVNNYQRLLELAKVRKAAGKVADLDVAEARAALDQTQSQLLQAQSEFSDVTGPYKCCLGVIRHPRLALPKNSHRYLRQYRPEYLLHYSNVDPTLSVRSGKSEPHSTHTRLQGWRSIPRSRSAWAPDIWMTCCWRRKEAVCFTRLWGCRSRSIRAEHCGRKCE
jgi:hypothetical protein